MINKEDTLLLSRRLEFWDQMTQPQKEALAAGAKAVSYKKGQPLHCGECQCMGVLVIKSGTLRIYITSQEGREVTLYRLDSGDICILSASCILQAITFDVFVEAETDCDILQINSSAFARLSAENVYAELFSYKLATQRFSDVMWAMQQILFTSFDKRLASFLLDESVKNASDVIHMTHEQIAKHLGSAREEVSRMLKYFSREGYVALSRGGITITDKKQLRALVLQ